MTSYAFRLMAVIVGSGLGGGARFLVAALAERLGQRAATGSFPYGTLAVNLIGCFLIGLIYAGVFERWHETHQTRVLLHAFLLIGVLGGFTTFSSFGLDVVSLGRGGPTASAWVYLLLTNAVGIGLVWAGLRLGESLF